MHIALVVAQTKTGVIGIENRLPWHLPADLKHFRQITLGKPIIMGRKTFDSIGKALPGRTNIVISRQALTLKDDSIIVTNSIEQAIDKAKKVCCNTGANEIAVIGGEQIYKLAMPFATKIYLTEVDATLQGDAFFNYDAKQWHVKSEEKFQADATNEFNFRVCVLEK